MSWLQVAVLAPFVLLGPGYAIGAALFPPGTLDPSDRAVYTFVFSISAASIGALLLQVVLGLGTAAWLALLLAITLGAAVVARRRRASAPIQMARRSLPRPPAGVLWALASLIALVAAGAAIAIASNGVREQQSRQVFASLWALPDQAAKLPGRPAPLQVGVWNHGGPSAYRLQVSRAGKAVESFSVRVGADRHWQATLPGVTSRTGSLEIILFRASRPYRRLRLNMGVGQ